jgi:hypothetical protein
LLPPVVPVTETVFAVPDGTAATVGATIANVETTLDAGEQVY